MEILIDHEETFRNPYHYNYLASAVVFSGKSHFVTSSMRQKPYVHCRVTSHSCSDLLCPKLS